MESYLEEELDQYTEDERSKMLSTDSLKIPISDLGLPPATLITPKTTIAEAIKIMQDKRFGALLIEDHSKLVGVVTERDILMKVAGKTIDISKSTVSEIMTRNPESLQMSDAVVYAMNLMVVGGYRHVAIIDENRKPLSILSIRDIVSYLTGFFESDILNLPPKPLRENQAREGA